MRDGSRLTRYEYRDTRTSTPSKACADTAAPPIVPQPLQQPHPKARPGQVAGRDQAVVAAAYDYGVYGVDIRRALAQFR